MDRQAYLETLRDFVIEPRQFGGQVLFGDGPEGLVDGDAVQFAHDAPPLAAWPRPSGGA